MQTIKFKNIVILLIMLISYPSFSQGLPEDEEDVNDEVIAPTAPTAPINQNLLFGFLGGILIAGYFMIERKKGIQNN
jgi:hypothetical protein